MRVESFFAEKVVRGDKGVKGIKSVKGVKGVKVLSQFVAGTNFCTRENKKVAPEYSSALSYIIIGIALRKK